MAIDTIVTQFLTRGEDNLRATLQGLSSDISTFEGKQARLGIASNALIAGGAGVAGALGAVGVASLKSAGQIEGVEAGLTSMLGSADAAQAKIKDLQKFASTTPFDFGQTAAASQQLLAMGFAGEDLIPTLNSVGNAVAAAGGGTEEFRGVLLALGQIKTKGKLSAEELMQMAERGIPVFQILQKQLGLTKEQVSDIGNSGLDAEKGIAALLAGMKEVGGGTALEEMSETLPGKLSNLGDSVNQLSGSVGKLFSNDAKDFLGGVTEKLDKLREWVEKNPDLAKKILTAVGIGAAGAVGLGVIGKAAGIYNEITGAVETATKGKKALEAATKADDLAEKAKAATAGIEADAIGEVGEQALDTAEDMGFLAKAKSFLASPFSVGGRTFTQIGGGTVTNGLAMGGAAIGAAAGYGAYDDWNTLGKSKIESAILGIGTAGAAGAAAMFVPGAAIPLAIATGFRYVFNELVNRPMEQEAEQGSGANDEELKRLSTAKVGEEQARIYDEIAARQESEATERTWSDWLLDPNNERLTDRQLGKLEDARSSRAAAARQRSSGQVRAEEEAREASRQRLLAHEKKSKEEERLKRLQNATDFYNSTQGVQTQRNGARTVTLRLPESSGDEMARQLAYNSNTATPNYG